MSKKLTVIVAGILATCLILAVIVSMVSPFLALAAPTQADVNSAQKKVEEIEKKKKVKENEKKSVLQTKSALELEIAEIQKELDACNEKLTKSETELKEAEEKEKKQYETMKIRLRTMYEDNSASYIELIFNGESLTDAIFSYELIKQLLEYDNNMYDNLTKTRQEIEEVKASIEKEKNTIQSQKEVLDTKNASLQKTVDALNADIAQSQKEMEAAEAEMRRVRQQYLNSINNSGPAGNGAMYTGGRLQWPSPVTKYITSQYGYRFHPTLKVWKGHTGIDIGAGYGTDVVAAESGSVTVAGYNVAYGNYIIINHGGGLSTLYAHNSKLLVSVGQSVSRGQTIAKVGSTGYSTGPHIHFEVMVNGATTDPMPYL